MSCLQLLTRDSEEDPMTMPTDSTAKQEKVKDPKRRPAAIGRRLLFIILAMYVLYLGVALVMQETLYFPRYMTGPAPAQPDLPRGVESIWIEPESGVRVEAWLGIPERASADEPAPLVVFTHGNGELIDHNTLIVDHYLALGFAILMPEYRGYGRSTGKPNQRDITSDVLAFMDLAMENERVADRPVVYHGRSIGGGILGSVAAVRPPDAMVIESSFTSLRAMMGRYLVPPFIARNHMDTNSVIAELDIPILIIHGDHDFVIPVSHAHRNAATARDAELIIIDGFGHNDIFPTDPPFRDALQRMLDKARAAIPPEEPEPIPAPTEEPADEPRP